ncbi:phosphatase PAP2 family protein [Sulfurimonas sp. HSL-3221]|uniref:phosphatase PAP2 family protein n=1 Tax=Sulfurimonadaceae TaxID=2771471 RepID=UPI001E28C891|nr:phosphatase PAP2 family protein [Sulfurimonas sp. HSL-3221]UFS63611.1 phosphatase PAP2 family protein [Sulfurimonas sp. HSL-3221]
MIKVLATIPLWEWVAMAVLSLLFFLFPQIDLAVAALFYAGPDGFPAAKTLAEQVIYYSVPYGLMALYIGAVLLWLFNTAFGRSVWRFTGRKLLYVLLVLGIGSGLIVNALFKEHWGRARPAETMEFGGKKEFSPAFVPVAGQVGNSFSCGHASGAFALLAFAKLSRRRRLWNTIVLGYGLIVGMARMAAGGHFLSDVAVSFFIMYTVTELLYAVLFPPKESP